MERWDRVGSWAAYGAAWALTPYALVKVSWVVLAILGAAPIGAGFDLLGWVLLNLVTIGMAALGIVLALALVRPWGMRIPGRPLAFCAWTGAGFLVSVLPYFVLSAVLRLPSAPGEPGGGGEPAMPGWEAVLIQCSFVGTGVGLAVALPAYARRRRPELFAGRVGDGAARTGVAWPAVVGAVIGAVWLYWALGGSWGIDHAARWNGDGYLLMGLGALWALVGSAAVWTLERARPVRLPRWLPLALGWLGSGSLFAWSAWKLALTVFVALAEPADALPPENLAVAGVLHCAAVLAGAGMARRLVRSRTAVA
ncbi:hypothetical protein ACO0M4_15095 [Streptomyces sp. RGM 3693]|uniref:hypothetical protein n=1 Tax=Streptomyces sp. RGM 3693 TaxID=3413284 RepID=UPI003D2DEDB3